MPMGGLFGWGGEMTSREQDICNKLFLFALIQDLYYPDAFNGGINERFLHLKKAPFMDIWLLLSKFSKFIYGMIKQDEVKRIPSVNTPKYVYQFNDEIPKLLYSIIRAHKITLISDYDVRPVVSFIRPLRKLFITLAIDGISDLYNTNITYIESLKTKLSQVNEVVFLELYRALANVELQMSFSEVFKNAAMGGRIRSERINDQRTQRFWNLKASIESMSHDEILDLLSTKRNCFNKLFELDYDYQQDEKNKVITKSKLSLQQIKDTVTNQDGTYNLASTSVGKWLVKDMSIYFHIALRSNPNYKLYCEISWFKKYIPEYLKNI